jgi:spore germination protein GerM
MKLVRFRLQPSHWFSSVLLVVLAMSVYHSAGTRNHPLPKQDSQLVTIYHMVSSSVDQWLEPIPGNVPPQEEPMVGALNLMAALPPDESPLPPGTHAVSVGLRDDGVAWADFNKALVDNFPGGSLQESLTINSVLQTLAQFPGVRAVQFTVEGEIIESIGGHVDVSEPQPVPDENATPDPNASPDAIAS